MNRFIISVVLSLGVSSTVFAQQRRDTRPPVSMVVPSAGSSTISENKFVVLVIESAHISHEGSPISAEGLISYLNTTMSAEEAPYLAVHIREGVT